MAVELPSLPYAEDALEPHMSQMTVRYHYGEHHKGYVNKLNDLIRGTEYESQILYNIVLDSARSIEHEEIFNNAAQVWNHNFFWAGMKPAGKAPGEGSDMPIFELFDKHFGSFAKFQKLFIERSVDQFGSGYSWLTTDGTGLQVITTANAETPIIDGVVPLLNCDLWEHAYYLDYQNQRATFVETFIEKLVDWQKVNFRLSSHAPAMARELV